MNLEKSKDQSSESPTAQDENYANYMKERVRVCKSIILEALSLLINYEKRGKYVSGIK